jgi:hypothetical protein
VLNMSSSDAHFVVKDSTEFDKSQTNPRNSLIAGFISMSTPRQSFSASKPKNVDIPCNKKKLTVVQPISNYLMTPEREREREREIENSWMSTGILRRWITHRVDPELHANTHQRVSKFCAIARGGDASSSP